MKKEVGEVIPRAIEYNGGRVDVAVK